MGRKQRPHKYRIMFTVQTNEPIANKAIHVDQRTAHSIMELLKQEANVTHMTVRGYGAIYDFNSTFEQQIVSPTNTRLMN